MCLASNLTPVIWKKRKELEATRKESNLLQTADLKEQKQKLQMWKMMIPKLLIYTHKGTKPKMAEVMK